MQKLKKLTKYFLKDIRLRNRLIISNLIIVILPIMVVGFMFFNRFYLILQKNVLNEQMTISYHIDSKIESIITRMLIITDVLYNNPQLVDLLQLGSYKVEDKGNKDLNSSLELVDKKLSSYIDEGVVSDIKIYYKDGAESILDREYKKDATLFEPISKISNTYWKGIFDSKEIVTLIVPDYYLSQQEKEENGNFAVIKKMNYYQGDQPEEAFIAVYHNSEDLKVLLNDDAMNGEAVGYIINERDNLVAFNNETQLGMYMLNYDEIPELFKNEGQFHRMKFAGEQVFISYRNINNADWRLVWIVPHKNILQESKVLALQIIFSFSLMIGVSLLIGSLITSTIVKRINILKNQMEYVRTERPKPLNMEQGKDEIGELIETYNYMAIRINSLVNKELEIVEELNAVKLKALRAQIDPHFLYNTLDMIRWFSEAGENNSVMEAIIALSKFYKLTLNKGNLTGTVSKELEHVTIYVKLMNMRFGNKIHLLIDVPDEMMDYNIPMIIFQPIVENSIQHGIFEKDSQEGNIIITGWMDENNLYFMISDDGIGMTEEQLSNVLNKGSSKEEGNGIGVYNTHRRLQILYQEKQFGLSYSGKYGVGTDVEIRIPKVAD